MLETKSPRSKSFYVIGTLTLMAVYAGAVVLAKTHGPAFYWVAAAAVVAVGVMSGGWTSKLDEVAQHAHVQAWFWGGLAGLVFATAGLFAFMAVETGPMTFTDRAFIAGFGFALGPMALGYLTWWASFWLRRR